MTVSLTALRAMFANQTGEVFLTCVTIEHADLATPLRLVNDVVDLPRAAGVFIAFPFRLTMPADSDTELPQVQLTVDNVDRSIVETIRSLASPPSVTLEVVLASQPDTVEAGPFPFQAKGAQYNASEVMLSLAFEADLLSLRANRWLITPQSAPGSF